MRVFVSMPMKGLVPSEIESNFEKIASKIKQYFPGTECINGYYSSTGAPVYCLSKAIGRMAICDAVYFADGWDNARGCRIEHLIATEYGLKILTIPEEV